MAVSYTHLDVYKRQVWSPTLTNDAMPVASLCENSIAIGKGTATYAGITIPTADQLGNVRPSTPSVGAVAVSYTHLIMHRLIIADFPIIG